MKALGLAVVLVCCALSGATAQDTVEPEAVTKVMALEHAWNQAEQRKDTKALDALFDSGLIYIDYDGSLRTKAEFLARVKSAVSQPEQEVTESMTGRMFGSTVVVTGVYVAKGAENKKPYVRRGRFVDTWIFRKGQWVCVASQATPLLH